MSIIVNGKPLHKSSTPKYKLVKIKRLISNRKSVDEICSECGVTKHTVRMVREGIM